MRPLSWILLVLGLATFGVLLHQTGWENTAQALSAVGLGFVLVFAQEIVPFTLNTLGWRFMFRPGETEKIPFSRLLYLRITGDGLNYLTPSAGLAGEWARIKMLGPALPLSSRLASVGLAKLSQGIAMALTALMVVLFVVQGKLRMAQLSGSLTTGVWLLGALLAAVLFLQWRSKRDPEPEDLPAEELSGKKAALKELKQLDRTVGRYLRDHPGRFAMSVLSFWAAFVWGMFEVWLITRFMGVGVDLSTALAIETLSVLFDGLFILVPGKIGTQEVTRTAIFAGLGMSPAAGFAYGVVRHLREIAWAVLGLALFSWSHRKKKLDKQPVAV